MTKSHLFTLNSQLFSKGLFSKELFSKGLLFTLLASLFTLLTACGTMRQVSVQTVREVAHDTLYFNKVQYDSVYIDQWRSQEYHPSALHSSPSTLHLVDTIYVEKVRLEYKYKFLKDTVRVVQIDSIPVIREVEVVKTEHYTPWIYRASLWAVIIIVVCLILFVLWKFLKSKL